MQQYSQQTMKRSTDMKTRLEEAILGTHNARCEMMMRRKNSGTERGAPPSPGQAPDVRLRWTKDQTRWRNSSDVDGSVTSSSNKSNHL